LSVVVSIIVSPNQYEAKIFEMKKAA